jgi:hypothetical protein
MLQHVYTSFLVALVIGDAQADQPAQLPRSNRDFAIHQFWGEASNALQPYVSVSAYTEDWGIEIGFLAQTNFPHHTWLNTTNRFGSKLQLWLTNEVEVPSKDAAVLAAFHVPPQTTVSNILRSVRYSVRGMQWLSGEAHRLSATADFGLRSAFNLPLTNDMVLQITPLIYRVDTNLSARLVEFAPIKMRLMANGNVQEIRNKE